MLDAGNALVRRKGWTRTDKPDAQELARRKARAELILKMQEGRPNIVDALVNGDVQLVINTPFGQETRSDGYHIRTAAVQHGVPNITTVAAANAVVSAIDAFVSGRLDVIALQDFGEDDQ